jgi:hypothetical protein
MVTPYIWVLPDVRTKFRYVLLPGSSCRPWPAEAANDFTNLRRDYHAKCDLEQE